MWNKLKSKIESYAPKAKKYKLSKERALEMLDWLRNRYQFEEFVNDRMCLARQEDILLEGCHTWNQWCRKNGMTDVAHQERAFRILTSYAHEIYMEERNAK